MSFRSTDRPIENCPTENPPVLQRIRKVGTPGDIHRLAICVCIAEGLATQIGGDESEESRKPGPHPCHRRIAPLAIFRLYRREFGQRNQDLPNALNDLLLLFGGELSETERLILYVHLARASKVNFVVRLNRDSGQ